MSRKSTTGSKKSNSIIMSTSSRKKKERKTTSKNDSNPLDDSDDEEEDDIDELLNTRIFTPHKNKSKKPKLIIGKRYSIPGSGISNNDDDSKKDQLQKNCKAKAMTTEEIEAEGK